MEPSAFRELARRFAQAGLPIPPEEEDAVWALAYVMARHLRRKVHSSLRQATDLPVLACYQNDGWSTWVVTRHKTKSNGRMVWRNARTRHEFLLQAVWDNVYHGTM